MSATATSATAAAIHQQSLDDNLWAALGQLSAQGYCFSGITTEEEVCSLLGSCCNMLSSNHFLCKFLPRLLLQLCMKTLCSDMGYTPQKLAALVISAQPTKSQLARIIFSMLEYGSATSSLECPGPLLNSIHPTPSYCTHNRSIVHQLPELSPGGNRALTHVRAILAAEFHDCIEYVNVDATHKDDFLDHGALAHLCLANDLRFNVSVATDESAAAHTHRMENEDHALLSSIFALRCMAQYDASLIEDLDHPMAPSASVCHMANRSLDRFMTHKCFRGPLGAEARFYLEMVRCLVVPAYLRC